jgi:hypothetical protein
MGIDISRHTNKDTLFFSILFSALPEMAAEFDLATALLSSLA